MESYQSIAHLVRSVHLGEDVLNIEFCSDCGELQQTVSVTRASLNNEETPTFSLTDWLKGTMQRVLGRQSNPAQLSQDEKEEAVCRAFEELRPRLLARNGKWVRGLKDEHPGEYFDRQLRANPIIEKYDIEVLVRVLVEVSRSDSELRTEERAFLEEIVQDQATIQRLAKAPRITVAELAETSSVPVKETILMLSWAMAYADGHLDNDEMGRLNQLCRGFMLPQKRVRELQMAAKLFLLDRHIQSLKGNATNAELRESFDAKARCWGLDKQQLETLRSWYPGDLSPKPDDV